MSDAPEDASGAQEAFGKGAGHTTGSLPIGFRSRARRLYRIRREQLMEIPVAALRERFGDGQVEVDEHHQYARVESSSFTLELGFAGTYRMFGALIDMQWVALRGVSGSATDELEYRFDRKAFVAKKGADEAFGARLADRRTVELAGRSELKALKVANGPVGRKVTITPLPGTITAVYFPPLPPYSVPLKPQEARDHIALALHLLDC
ncbi:MAG: hypothetical protein ACFCVC_10600 [Acidimicrobiia bacterium]